MTFIEFANFLSQIPPVILTLGLVAGVFVFKSLDSLHRSLFWYMALMLGTDLAGRVLKFTHGNNLIVLPVYSLIELGFFVYFYNRFLLVKPNKILIGLGIVGAVYIIAEILGYFVLNTLDIKQFQPYAKVLDNFLIIIMALAFVQEKMANFKESGWGNFKLNTVILVFFTLTIIIFLPFNFLINGSSDVKFYFWIVNVIAVVLFYLFLISEIWKNGRTQK